MDINDLKSNADADKEKEIKGHNLKKVVEGKGEVYKRGAVSKIAKAFLARHTDNDDPKDIISGIIVPAVKDMIRDASGSLIEWILYGTTNGTNSYKKRSSQSSYTSYYKAPSSTYKPSEPAKDLRARSGGRSVDDIVIPTRWEAEEVIDKLTSCIADYNYVSIGDFYELVGLPTNYTDYKYGWKDLAMARISHVRNGYVIALPTAYKLD